jgi:hypothetical protein
MRKQWLLLLVGLILVLGACSGQEQSTATLTSEPDGDVQVTETDPSADQAGATEPPQAAAVAAGESEKIASSDGTVIECTVTGLLPEVDPTTQAIFPTVSAEEWAKGPEDATLTIVEYSDFQ